MCYPCTMCNGCGKMNDGIGSILMRKERTCSKCGEDLLKSMQETRCPSCNMRIPLPPGFTRAELA